jgi:hypothetical protein
VPIVAVLWESVSDFSAVDEWVCVTLLDTEDYSATASRTATVRLLLRAVVDDYRLNIIMKISEIITRPKPPKTPDQARIEALKAQVKRSQAAVKTERARQPLQAAQRAVAAGVNPPS